MASRKRKLKRWHETFLKWTLPVSEAPESLLIWSGLFCISSALKRKVRFSKEYVKKYDIYPNTFLIFVGKPGVVRKSTSAGYAYDILSSVNEGLPISHPAYINLGPSSGSQQKILDKVADTVDGSMTLIAGEFGNIVATSPVETLDFLAKMFDADLTAAKFEHSTRGSGDTVVLDPSFNLLGCTTPGWMAENQGYIVGGGFAARTIFIFEYFARQRRLFFKDVGPTMEELEKMKKDLVHDLKIIGRLEGEAKPESEELAQEMEDWYQGFADKAVPKERQSFQARKHNHVLSTCILLSASERDDLVITKGHFEASKVLIQDVEQGLDRGFASIGRNPYSHFMYEVLDYIESNGPVHLNKLMARFFSDLQPEELFKILEILGVSGKVQGDTTTRMYKIRKD